MGKQTTIFYLSWIWVQDEGRNWVWTTRREFWNEQFGVPQVFEQMRVSMDGVEPGQKLVEDNLRVAVAVDWITLEVHSEFHVPPVAGFSQESVKMGEVVVTQVQLKVNAMSRI